MATYGQIYDRTHNNDFVNRVEVAIVAAAIAISAESAQTANHANRAALAQKVLQSPAYWSKVMAVGVGTDATVQSGPTDANIYNAVAGQWNAYAGTAA